MTTIKIFKCYAITMYRANPCFICKQLADWSRTSCVNALVITFDTRDTIKLIKQHIPAFTQVISDIVDDRTIIISTCIDHLPTLVRLEQLLNRSGEITVEQFHNFVSEVKNHVPSDEHHLV